MGAQCACRHGTPTRGRPMTKTDLGGFEPRRLRLARELRGWNQVELAGRVRLSSAAISQFEAGTTAPSGTAIERLAIALDVPDGFLALPFVETHEGFFRSLRRTSLRQRRKARAIAYVAHDLALSKMPDPSSSGVIPKHPVEDLQAEREEIEELAAQVRSEWKQPRGPIDDVVGLLESHGVIVIRLPMDSGDVDAFSLPFPDHGVVVLASDKNDRARSRFDAAHELGHLVMHGNQVWGVKEVEQQAHWFAAAFLMPAGDIFDELPQRADWPTLFSLKRKWQVSIAALLMRAKSLGKMSPTTYLGAVKETSARGWRRVEPIPLGECEQPANRLLHSKRVLSSELLPADILEGLLSVS